MNPWADTTGCGGFDTSLEWFYAKAIMKANQPAPYYAMLALTAVFTVLAIITLLPNPGAVKPNILGYRSVCSFAPAATAICGLLAGLCCTLRNRFVASNAAGNRRGPWFGPWAAGVLLGSIALVGGISWANAQNHFAQVISRVPVSQTTKAAGLAPDGVHGGSVAEGDVSASVQVTVAAGTIIKIDVLQKNNLETSLTDALGKQVIEKQSVDVDAVSGATASSKVFLAAIAKALATQ